MVAMNILIFQMVWSKFQKTTNRGAWDGNDTIWRMVVDLYSIILKNGPRKFFSVIDGVIGGESNGPFCPIPKNSNLFDFWKGFPSNRFSCQ